MIGPSCTGRDGTACSAALRSHWRARGRASPPRRPSCAAGSAATSLISGSFPLNVWRSCRGNKAESKNPPELPGGFTADARQALRGGGLGPSLELAEGLPPVRGLAAATARGPLHVHGIP